ncbi:hypothetical protein BC940DRAFT_331793 [Gongronella butleri]|nr:hypothetical protein BC940DRAFT_331793 [Gongronella butleri]
MTVFALVMLVMAEPTPEETSDTVAGPMEGSSETNSTSNSEIGTDSPAETGYSHPEWVIPGILTSCFSRYDFALTFDDGPYEYTEDLLDLLQDEDVTATFFVNGHNYWKDDKDKVKHALKKIDEAGMQIASHTYTHPHLPYLSKKEITREMAKNEKIIYYAIGKYPAVMRPPFGEVDEGNVKHLNKLGYNVVTWNLDSEDWTHVPLEQQLHNVKKALKKKNRDDEGIIILQHETENSTVYDLTPEVIRMVRDKEMSFVSIADCLRIPAYKDEGIDDD